MKEFTFDSANETDTDRLGAALAAAIPAGAVVALIGTLGAGKTRLVQAFAAAHGVPRDETASPTFVLVHEYRGRLPIYHFDAYRVRDEDEFWALGCDEYFESGGVTFVEWADRVPGCLPAGRLEIRCEATGETSRRFTISATSPPLDPIIARINATQ